MSKPKTQQEWEILEYEILNLFDGAPINEEDLFAGRLDEVGKMLRTVMERSKHIVLFGEKGVGKTSLSNIFWKRYHKTLQSFVVARVQAGPHDNFSSLWIRALDELQAAAITKGKSELVKIKTDFETITPTEVRRELQKCNPNALPIIIIDEYDKIKDQDAKTLTANLIKELYDFSITTTVLLVGVAEDISQLIQDHNSLDRALVQIPLERMKPNELREIIEKRTKRTPIKFTEDAIWTVVILSRGLPYFTQTLAKHSAIHAVRNHRLEVTNQDVEASLDSLIEDIETSFKDAYRMATRSNQENNFQESLLACALANPDDEGFFTANDVVEPFSSIMKEKKRIAHFEKHLKRFTSDEGGNILIKRGGDRKQKFRFFDPMMQPYVIIRGIQSGMIDNDSKTILFQTAQRSLFPIGI